MREDIFCVLQSLGHFLIARFEGRGEWELQSLMLLVHVCYHAKLRAEDDFRLVLENHLDDLIAQAEHNRMLRSHPLLNVDASRLQVVEILKTHAIVDLI